MKDKGKNIEFGIDNFFLEADYADIKELLSEEVNDENLYTKNKEKHLRKINFLSKAIANKFRDEIALNNVLDKFQNAINNNIDKHLPFIKDMIYGTGTKVFYRSLDQLSREEISEMIKDKNLIEILEKFDENEEDN